MFTRGKIEILGKIFNHVHQIKLKRKTETIGRCSLMMEAGQSILDYNPT
jgi:hypothetical protein